jgi:hypothetical protein
MAASESKVMKFKDKSRITRRIVSGVVVSALAMFGAAMGCTKPASVAISNTEFEVENSCNGSDSSHTTASAVTCQYNVSSSSNDGAAISAGTPRRSCGKWVVDCYLNGIKCRGSRTKRPLSCTSPEYPATNQDVDCPATWRSDLRGLQGTVQAADDDSIIDQPTLQRAAQLCSNQYGNLLTDLNATANNMCNAAANGWTEGSKKSAVCCIPAPRMDAGMRMAPSTLICGAFSGDGDGNGDGCGDDIPPDAGLPDASEPGDAGLPDASEPGDAGLPDVDAGLPDASEPGDAGLQDASEPGDAGLPDASEPGDAGLPDASEPGDAGESCSIDDPSLGDESVPPEDDEAIGSASAGAP